MLCCTLALAVSRSLPLPMVTRHAGVGWTVSSEARARTSTGHVAEKRTVWRPARINATGGGRREAGDGRRETGGGRRETSGVRR